jgi:hypothetical protein
MEKFSEAGCHLFYDILEVSSYPPPANSPWEEIMKNLETSSEIHLPTSLKLRKLTLDQVRRIDQLLAELGKYGEVHIIVQNGELRYINKVESYDFLDRENRADV